MRTESFGTCHLRTVCPRSPCNGTRACSPARTLRAIWTSPSPNSSAQRKRPLREPGSSVCPTRSPSHGTEDADATVAGVGLAPYGSTSGCGVVLFHATVTAESRDEALDVFQSLVLDRPQATVPAHDAIMTAGGFDVDVPIEWEALSSSGGDGSLLRAIDCAGSVALRVTQETLPSGETLVSFVDAREADARDSGAGYAFPRRYDWSIDGDDSLFFQYQLAGDDPLVSRQVFVLRDDVVTIFTIESHRDDDDANFPTIQEVFRSINPQ